MYLIINCRKFEICNLNWVKNKVNNNITSYFFATTSKHISYIFNVVSSSSFSSAQPFSSSLLIGRTQTYFTVIGLSSPWLTWNSERCREEEEAVGCLRNIYRACWQFFWKMMQQPNLGGPPGGFGGPPGGFGGPRPLAPQGMMR